VNKTVTQPSHFSEPTPLASIDILYETIVDQARRERDLFLALVDERERIIKEEPRTSQIRQFWRDSGKPKLSRGKE